MLKCETIGKDFDAAKCNLLKLPQNLNFSLCWFLAHSVPQCLSGEWITDAVADSLRDIEKNRPRTTATIRNA